jgi:hypothetical protein
MADLPNQRQGYTASGQTLDQGYAALQQFIQADRVEKDNPLRDAIAYLAAQLQNLQTGQISLSQLPIADLQNQLAVTWHPTWTIDETDTSIMGSVVGGRVSVQTGIATAVFSGAAESALSTQAHTLGAVPIVVMNSVASGSDRITPFLGTRNGTQFQFVARSMTGSSLTGNYSFPWIAIG